MGEREREIERGGREGLLMGGRERGRERGYAQARGRGRGEAVEGKGEG